MASSIESSQRAQLAKFCSSRDWSKAIRVLDSLISQSCVIQDLCNRAFCYSQLELHKHVIKDCDKALKLDPTLIQSYILKGRALSSLGRENDALLIWEQGHAYAVSQSIDFKQLMELEELIAKQNGNIATKNTTGSAMRISDDESHSHNKSSEVHKNHVEMSEESNIWTWSSTKSDIFDTSGDNSDTHSDLSDKANGNEKSNCLKNGTHTKLNELTQLNDVSIPFNELSDSIKPCNKLPIKFKESSDKYEINSESNNKYDIQNDFSDAVKRNKQFFVASLSQNKSINVDFRLSRAIAQVNEGKYAHAISIFDKILRDNPAYLEALIGRGTAYAFKRELESAIADFTRAIQVNPSTGEAWKRRGQARAALGEPIEALEDLTKALEFEPNSTDILHERGIVNFKFKDFDAAVEDLSACVKVEKDNKSAHTYLGLALSSIGEYKRAQEAHMKSIQLDQNFVDAWAHLTQFYQDLANPTKALECLQEILRIDSRFAKAYYLRGLIFHGMGEHRKAIKDLSYALSIGSSNIESLYLRASCHHAIGEYGSAIKDYDAALDLELDSVEKFVLQCLAFYQKEIALYTASKTNSEFCLFDIDGDIDPLFKEYWCKRLHPKSVCEKVYRQPPLNKSLKKGKLKKQDFVMTKQKTALLNAADSIGCKIQYNCPGFLPNKRQHRMAGLAAIEIAQKVLRAWKTRQMEWKHSKNKGTPKNGKKAQRKERLNNILSQNRGGACSSTDSPLETSSLFNITEDGSLNRPMISWRDVYGLAVKWRQISEPCDPVVWINKLSEEFNSGFGSNTPITQGQAKVVRYFNNYQRAIDIAKAVMMENKYVHSKANNIINLSKDGKLEKIMNVKSCSDLYRIVGEDFWLATWCNSTAFQGKQLEGTRITLLKGEHGYDFAIRTPCTPSRWDDFDSEMATAWDTLCNAYCGEKYGSTDFNALENVRDAILKMSYYWYNFMPLSRGSAAVGFIVLLGLLLATNMEFTGTIPEGLQVDWEAIFNFDPDSFVDSVKSWLYPSLRISTCWKDYPDVASTLSTTGSVVSALSFSSSSSSSKE